MDKATTMDKSVQAGQTNDTPKFPTNMGIKGMKSVDDGAVRTGVAPTPRSLPNRDNG